MTEHTHGPLISFDGGYCVGTRGGCVEERVFFGLVQGFEVELGYFSRDELETVRGPYGLRIERDIYWRERTLGELKQEVHG